MLLLLLLLLQFLCCALFFASVFGNFLHDDELACLLFGPRLRELSEADRACVRRAFQFWPSVRVPGRYFCSAVFSLRRLLLFDFNQIAFHCFYDCWMLPFCCY
jgi:hypothetical protein